MTFSIFSLSLLIVTAGSVLSGPISKVPDFKWSNIKTVVSFGDSYSATGYLGVFGGQLLCSFTSSSGPVWPQYLTSNHSDTVGGTKLLNYAISGGTINSTLHPHLVPDFLTATKNFNSDYPLLNLLNPKKSETSETVLSTFFIGGNDLYLLDGSDPQFLDTETHKIMLSSYIQGLENVYKSGIRIFLIMNMIEGERTPLALALNESNRYWYKVNSEDYNRLIAERLPAWCESKGDAKCLFYDFKKAFGARLDSYSEDGFVSNTDYCESYSGITSALCLPDDRTEPPCSAVSTYFWKDYFHPTWKQHEFIASDIYDFLITSHLLEERSSRKKSKEKQSFVVFSFESPIFKVASKVF